MIYWRFYQPEKIYGTYGTRQKYVNKIFSFDIETTSFYLKDGNIFSQSDYDPQGENEDLTYCATMYIWMIGIDDLVLYGRTWEELQEFFWILDSAYPEKKIFFIHNLSFEFQFLRSVFKMDKVFARSKRKPIYCTLQDYNIEMRCTYFMTNNALEDLPKFYGLPVEKLTGDLDYSLIRHSFTALTKEEWSYCENDILVIYYYIRHMLTIYPNINNIPKTNTGQVRREFQELTQKDYVYKNQVRRMINTDPHVYNLLVEAFMGGYTHANYSYADLILHYIDGFDEASAYPAMLCLFPYPGTVFRKCYLSDPSEMLKEFAYLVRVEFEDLESRYDNNIISLSHCRNVLNGVYDNGRVMSAEKLEIVCTDIDLRLYMKAYGYKTCRILESYYSVYKYLPKGYVRFILDKYQKKTALKNVPGRELEYSKEKNRYNAIFGMSVTNEIRSEISFTGEWEERELTNEEIIDKLLKQKKKAFLSFSTGVWCTSWGRKALLENLLALDRFVVYADTDSLKLFPGYDPEIIENHNRMIRERTLEVCRKFKYSLDEFQPKDINGIPHPMGLFEYEGTYEKFKTLGAKKYCFVKNGEIDITISGVPKKGAECMRYISDFHNGFIFDAKTTEKKTHFYNDCQFPVELTDYTGKRYTVTDKTSICILPADYTLGSTIEYEELYGSQRALYKEDI